MVAKAQCSNDFFSLSEYNIQNMCPKFRKASSRNALFPRRERKHFELQGLGSLILSGVKTYGQRLAALTYYQINLETNLER